MLIDFEPTPEQKLYKPYFDKVCNLSDWRAPIDAYINREDVRMVNLAIIFYTGTIPEFFRISNTLYRVKAVGYRNGPCGP